MGELLTAEHVAKRSGISPAILRQPKWRRLHGLPAVRIGRLLRFEPDAVAAFCERQREGTDRAAARRPSPACRRARGGARRRRGDLHPVRLSAARRACNRRPSQPARDPCARIVAPLRSRRVDEGHRVADAAELDVVNCHRRQRGAGVVPAALWETAQAPHGRRRFASGRPWHRPYRLSGLVECAGCGKRFQGQRGSGERVGAYSVCGGVVERAECLQHAQDPDHVPR
jgi:hypothetical protein